MLSIIKLRLLRLRDDYLVFAVMTVMALGLTFVFGMSFKEYKPSIPIVDEDQSSYSRMLVKELKANGMFKYEESDYQRAVKSVEEGKVLTAVVIKQGFSGEIEGGRQVSITLVKIKDDIGIYTLQRIIANTAAKMAGSIRIAEAAADFVGAHRPDTDRSNIISQAYSNVMDSWKYKKPVRVTASIIDSDNQSSNNNMNHSMIGFSLFFSMFTIVFGVGTILYDKQYKTWQRMLVSPVSRASILGGSLVVVYGLGVLQLLVLILAGKYLIGIDWGNSIPGILTVAGAFVFAATCLGLLLSGIVKTYAQLGAVTPVVLTSTSMLGGCMWPLEIVNSKLLLLLADFTPQKWAIQGMEGIASYGRGFGAAVTPTLVLLLMGMIFFISGIRLVSYE